VGAVFDDETPCFRREQRRYSLRQGRLIHAGLDQRNRIGERGIDGT
jgi:hypothetical protein